MQKYYNLTALFLPLLASAFMLGPLPAKAQSSDCSACANNPNRVTYDMDAQRLSLPFVRVAESLYEVEMDLVPLASAATGLGFKVATTRLLPEATPPKDSAALSDDVLLIEEVTLLQDAAAIDVIYVDLELVSATNSPVFALRSYGKSGRAVFRYDTFGDEQFWTDTLQMNTVIATQVSPALALAVGLKVDADALPSGFLDGADLNDPRSTIALLERDAVLGLKGTVKNGQLESVGVTCALCHSNVDDSVAAGIGSRLDGFANRTLNTGAILGLSPAFADAQSQEILASWGPGRHDPRFNQDGINHPVLIPPIYGLKDVPLATYTGDGPISYWNSYVGVTQMGGKGNFFDARVNVAVFQAPDLVSPKLPELYRYQIGLDAPLAPAGSFDAQAAQRGQLLFNKQARCASCHAGPLFTDADSRLHTPAATGMEALTAQRSATGFYRTTPLRALWEHAPYFHDGSAATLNDVVLHYDEHLDLGLNTTQVKDLVEYLKSL